MAAAKFAAGIAAVTGRLVVTKTQDKPAGSGPNYRSQSQSMPCAMDMALPGRVRHQSIFQGSSGGRGGVYTESRTELLPESGLLETEQSPMTIELLPTVLPPPC